MEGRWLPSRVGANDCHCVKLIPFWILDFESPATSTGWFDTPPTEVQRSINVQRCLCIAANPEPLLLVKPQSIVELLSNGLLVSA